MEFAAFLVIYAVVTIAAWLARRATIKRNAKEEAAAAEAKAAAGTRPGRYADKATAASSQPRSLPTVSAFQARIRKANSNARVEPSLSIHDDEAMAQAFGYASVDEYRDDMRPGAPDIEEDVLGGPAH